MKKKMCIDQQQNQNETSKNSTIFIFTFQIFLLFFSLKILFYISFENIRRRTSFIIYIFNETKKLCIRNKYQENKWELE